MGVHAGGVAQAAPVRQAAADFATGPGTWPAGRVEGPGSAGPASRPLTSQGQAHGPQTAWKAQAGA